MGGCGSTPHAGTFFEHALDQAIPLSMQWDLTWRCDHKCVHCYLTERRQPELSLEEAITVLDQLAAAGTISILFSGGDLFLRPDALDILRAARERRFDLKINTHGNHIDDRVADELAEMGVYKVSVSVYSYGPEEHEAVTLIPGSHAKTLAAAKRLIERGVRVNFKTPVMLHNRTDWHRVGQLADEMGASWEIDGHIVPDDQSDFGLCSIGVHDTERMLAVIKGTEDRRAEVVPIDELPDTPSSNRTCSAGTASGYITPDGRLWACINWRDEIGSLREHSFQDLWHGSAKAQEIREIRRSHYLVDCDGCTFHTKCSYCPGISFAETGDAGRRSTYVCERTHLTMGAIEYLGRLNDQDAPIPLPGSPEAEALFSGAPTFAERQFAARKAGFAKPADRLTVGLVQIIDPRQG